MRVSWKEWGQRIEDDLAAYKKAPSDMGEAVIRAGVVEALKDDTRMLPTQIFQQNNYGKPHDAMSQMALAIVLIKVYKHIEDDYFLDLARKMIRVVTDLTKVGGLRTQTSAGSWFHGVTNTRSREMGGTLNKHLYTVRELANAARMLDPLYLPFAQAGYDQVISATKLNFIQFIPRSDSGKRTLRSWIWYSRTYEDHEGFHLKETPDRNGGYHCFCMDLIASFPEKGINMRDPTKLKWLADVYDLKEKEGLYKDSKPGPNGSFKALEKGRGLSPGVLEWFHAL